jgi:dihydrolipoamide dehydrogenase
MTLPSQPKSMIIVGSGAIGVEFAHFIMQWNSLLEFMQTLFLLKTKISKQMERSMKKQGKIMTNSSVEKIDTSGAG